MVRIMFFIVTFCLSGMLMADQSRDDRFYELRIYYCEPGKLPDLLARFRNHTLRLFEKHGMTNVGYWTPIDNKDNALYYILSYPNKASRETSWAGFMADPEWQRVWKESEINGKIVNRIESVYLQSTDFSPKIRKSIKGSRVFEMRTYTSPPGKLTNILARFRNHTMKLFKKHGMTNIAYWTTVESDSEQPKLLYLLAHKSEAAGKTSFDSFRQDPQWTKVREASERSGSIVEKVESIYMIATDFSRLR